MCIRDRERRAGERRRAERGFVEALAGVGEAAAVAADHLDICLLYTSDAADERSSVDLGGRRIIKKKNNHRNGVDIHT